MNPKGASPLTGIICLWSGVIADIPDGWLLCDGANGTPDLRTRFIIGAGDVVGPHGTGGTTSHTHDGLTGHSTDILEPGEAIKDLSPDGNWYEDTTGHQHTLAMNPGTNIPPYYALCYIMKT